MAPRAIRRNRKQRNNPARADLPLEGTTMHRLLRLFADNRGAGKYQIVRAADSDTAEIFLYDAIGGWDGITPRDFLRDLAAIDAGNIVLRINSPGGDVFDARAIAAAIADHPATITARVDGLAASAASYIALAADKVVMVKGSFLMIHNAWALVMGDKRDMAEMQALLDKVDGTIIDDYEAATGNTREQLQAWMDAETWFTADEAVQHKFAAEVIDGKAAAASWNLASYRHAPAQLKAPAAPTPTPPAEPNGQNTATAHQARVRRLRMLEHIG